MATKTTATYKQLRAQLDEALAWFEAEDLDVDEAIKQYELALEVAKQLEAHLSGAEVKITELKKQLPA